MESLCKLYLKVVYIFFFIYLLLQGWYKSSVTDGMERGPVRECKSKRTKIFEIKIIKG